MTGYLIGGAVACAAFLCVALSPRLKVRNYTLESKKCEKSLRILHLSDLHNTVYGKGQKRLVNIVKSAKPELIVLTGDMLHDIKRAFTDTPIMYKEHPTRILLEEIVKLAPVYWVFGNHEHAIDRRAELEAELSALGVRVLNGYERSCIGGEPICIVGMDDPRFFASKKYKRTLKSRIEDDSTRTTPELEKWRERVRELSPKDASLSILLSHRPEEFELYFDCGFDISFSGHAHGGQWRIPFVLNGLYAPHQGLFPKHAGGLYRRGDMVHVVSRGLSISRYPRIFNRPEVCILDVVGTEG